VFKKINPHTVLDETLLFVAPSLQQSKVEIITHYSSFEPLIMGDQELLKQVFLNLIWNGLQSMPQGGELTVSSRRADSGPVSSRARGYVEFEFKDTGTGISECDMKKIFTPFFTTKENGAGLGLAIAHRIIEIHGGLVEVKSRVSRGSAFTITLPLLPKIP
jgi:signal transduction histidine kinase